MLRHLRAFEWLSIFAIIYNFLKYTPITCTHRENKFCKRNIIIINSFKNRNATDQKFIFKTFKRLKYFIRYKQIYHAAIYIPLNNFHVYILYIPKCWGWYAFENFLSIKTTQMYIPLTTLLHKTYKPICIYLLSKLLYCYYYKTQKPINFL